MKNKYLIFIALLICLIINGFTRLSKSRFYYAYGEKIYLGELDNKLIVRYKDNKKSDASKISLYSKLANKQIEWKDDSTCIINLDAFEKNSFRNEILSQWDVKSCNPVYAINTGFEMGITDEFIVKFNENVKQSDIDKLHRKYNVEIVKKTDFYQLLRVPDRADALEIANIYQESGLTHFSHPNFFSKVELHQVIPNDPYFGNQYSLNNTGQVFTDGYSGTDDADIDAPEAWTLNTGNSNIIIAVIDQGVTSGHPDLPNSRQVRLNGSNFGDGDSNNPSPTGDGNHGNACAGLVGATQNNNQGISGIAPNCKIMPIRIFNSNGGGVTIQKLADAIDFAWQHGAHIISNSWGFGAGATNPNLYPVIRDAIIRATTQGRNGLGCVVAFSASNSARHNIGIDGEIRFPANVDIAGVLTVGASDRYDQQANYSPTSNPGSQNNQIIDIVAPSHRAYSCQISDETFEVWSLDIPDNAGYNPVHENDCGSLPIIGSVLPNTGTNNLSYTARFGGTSAACPQVAAVAALILSTNPTLTQMDVFNIITQTADHVGGYLYTEGRSNEMGFGRLNACNAVMEAYRTGNSITGPSLFCSTTDFSIQRVPLNASYTWSASNNFQILSGQGTASIHVNRISGGSGTISVTLTCLCGNIDLTRTIYPNVISLSKEYDYIDCNNNIITATTSGNSLIWETTNGLLINGMPSPQSNIGNTVTISSPYGTDGEVKARNCYEISTINFDPCVEWYSNLRFTGQNPGNPLLGEPLQAEADVFGDVNNYRWYIDGQFLEHTYEPVLSTYNWQCGEHNLQVQAVTPYGVTDIWSNSSDYWGLCSGYYMSLSPNPASDYVEVSITQESTKVSTASINNTVNNTYTVRVLNSYGTQVYNSLKSSNKFNIPISNLNEGIYIVEVSDGKNVNLKQLLVKKN